MPDDGFEIDATGLLHLIANIQAHLMPIVRRACLDVAEDVAAQTHDAVPVRSGELAASVSASALSDGAQVAMTTPYASWIEYGGSRGRPHTPEGRYLGAAAQGSDWKIATKAERDLERGARTW